ncbi:hypothetical protein PZ938_17890 [Luteipulveratus sp. YIM 133132]|uniref:hypothetical protein n=1 Tax=Luteipulveratus flavus TaxID=3031728 RepID=UPI0023B11DD0|nr:hypothetical protein [Luteipulveratus sp. YIM 133132]MDE9367497.1 hypothetical protein [Luteipulveratus sp. YIM 133132]
MQGRRSWMAAWSHNDEDRRRPLLDALEHGCAWIEPDVWVVGDQVLVGHDRRDARHTLAELYLDPLRDRAADLTRLYLVLDVKSEPAASLPVIERALSAYDDVLTHVVDDVVVRRPVTALLSGTLANRSPVRAGSVHLAYDGRLGLVPPEADPAWMPLVSAHWRDHFWWSGFGPLLPRDHARLTRFVDEAHERGLLLRFWGVPEWTRGSRRRLWEALLDAGVDVITTDHLTALTALLEQREGHQEVSRGRPSS